MQAIVSHHFRRHRVHIGMLQQSTHALVKRLLFSGGEGAPGGPGEGGSGLSFWSYTHTEAEVSLIIDEDSLGGFPSEAITGASTSWRAVKLCGREFAWLEQRDDLYAPG